MNKNKVTLSEKEQQVREMAINVTYDIADYLLGINKDKLDLVERIILNLSKLLHEPIITRDLHVIYNERRGNGSVKVHHEINNIFSTLLLGFSTIQENLKMKQNEDIIKKVSDIDNRIERLYHILVEETRSEGWDILIQRGINSLRRSIRDRVGDILISFKDITLGMTSNINLSKAIDKGKEISRNLKERMVITGNNLNGLESIKIGEREGVKEITDCLDELIKLIEEKSEDHKKIARLFLNLGDLVNKIMEIPDTHS